MFITALGKHLPFVFSRFHGDQGDPYWLNHMLDLVYLVESARHSMEKFLRLTMGQGNAPSTFQSGVDFSGAELDRQWRVMASYIEFESFMSAAKRFLDRAWCALSEERGGDCGKIRTLGKILLRKEPKIRRFREQLSQCEYFTYLEDIWNKWGNELASIRNYAEHNSPFGGRSVGYTICRDGTEEIILVLPDRIPGSTDATPKDKLPYSNQRSATALVRESMEHIDRAMEQLVEAADLHRKQCPLRQIDPKTNTLMRRRLLVLFNERVDRLLRSELATRMADKRFILSYEKMMNREWICGNGITEDAVDAFVLNIRLLIQDEDGFSIRCLAEDVYSNEAVPKDLRDRFANAREIWRKHLDGVSLFKHFTKNRNFTNRELFEFLMYGGLAHANSDKVNMFFGLTKQGAFSAFVFSYFLMSLRLLLDVVCSVRNINDELAGREDAHDKLYATRIATSIEKLAD